MKPAWAPAPSRTSTDGIPPCVSTSGCRCWVRRCSSSCWAAGWASAGLSETKKGGRRTISCSASLLAKTILNALRYALGIFSGKTIYNFGTPERLRTLRRTIFTGRGAAGNCICTLYRARPLKVKASATNSLCSEIQKRMLQMLSCFMRDFRFFILRSSAPAGLSCCAG